MSDVKIMIVDDEPRLRKLVKDFLVKNGYIVVEATDGEEAYNIFTSTNDIALIIMDVMMPLLDGIEAMKIIRSMGIDIPIILLTAKSELGDKINGLDSGANDYITKPFNKDELLARIRSLLRTQKEKKKKYNIANITFDKENSELFTKQISFHLNVIECNILEILVKNINEYIPIKVFENIICPIDKDFNCKINMYISYLQNKLKLLSNDIKIIILSDKYKLEKKI